MIPKAPILEPEQIETWADKQDCTHIAVLNDTEISREAQRDADAEYYEAKLTGLSRADGNHLICKAKQAMAIKKARAEIANHLDKLLKYNHSQGGALRGELGKYIQALKSGTMPEVEHG